MQDIEAMILVGNVKAEANRARLDKQRVQISKAPLSHIHG